MTRPLALLLLCLGLGACGPAARTAAEGGPETVASAPDGSQLALSSPRPAPGGLAPAQLKGLSGAAVTHMLGRPAFVRRDPPAEIWQYRVKACTLDLFLYEEKGRLSVAHHAVRAPNGGFMGDVACLDEVLRARDGLPVS